MNYHHLRWSWGYWQFMGIDIEHPADVQDFLRHTKSNIKIIRLKVVYGALQQ